MTRDDSTRDALRSLPSVDALLSDPDVLRLLERHPRAVVVGVARAAVDAARRRIADGDAAPVRVETLVAEIQREAQLAQRPSLRRVINATGIVVHTGLGRSVLADEAARAVAEAARAHSNLEMNLDTGERGHRDDHLAPLLCQLTGAESATVVNNNAAAVLLALNTLAEGQEVILSRGEMIEIGGAFRLPEVIAKSGCRLVEVGTTNKTHLADYERAITPETGAILRAHPSNYRVVGFTERPALADVVAVAHAHSLPVLEDLGSGALVEMRAYGIGDEPSVQESVRSGADIICFSGDKLLGGPQGGIILGRKDLIARIRRNPLARAFRIDKFTIAALEATLRLYEDESAAVERIPTLAAATASAVVVRRRAARLQRALRSALGDRAEVWTEEGAAQVGGGSLPMDDLPTRVVAVRPRAVSTEELARRLRLSEPAVVGRVQRDLLLLDARTIRDDEIREVADVAARALPE